MKKEEIIDKDGFVHCPICGDAVERELEFPFMDGSGGAKKMKVHCMCRCEMKKKEAYEQILKFEEEQRRIQELRKLSLMDAKLKDVRFCNYKVNDENRKVFGIAKRYVEIFDEMFSNNQGILFWGNVGTGKSYTAAAIANELIDRRIPIIMTSFIKLLKELGNFDNDDALYIDKLNRAKLLIIDDLGAERGTEFALEKVYDIIDSRYRSGKPIILTTNLEMTQMKNCDDIRYNRIYDRIFEMCYPVKVDGLSWRKKEAAARFADTRKILED